MQGAYLLAKDQLKQAATYLKLPPEEQVKQEGVKLIDGYFVYCVNLYPDLPVRPQLAVFIFQEETPFFIKFIDESFFNDNDYMSSTVKSYLRKPGEWVCITP